MKRRTVWNPAKLVNNVGVLIIALVAVWVAVSYFQVIATNINLNGREPLSWNIIDIIIKLALKQGWV